MLCMKSVKHADKPDSVHSGCPPCDRHYSGPGVATSARCYLPVDSAGRLTVHLFGIAARRDCPFHPVRVAPFGLVSVALILTLRWRGITSYAALCSPDVPPVPCFHACTSGGLACFTAAIIRDIARTSAAAAQTPVCSPDMSSNPHAYSPSQTDALPALRIVPSTTGLLSAQQEKFNHQLQCIDHQRQLLAQWQAAIQAYHERSVRDLRPLQAQHEREQAALVELLEHTSAVKLSKAERTTVQELLRMLAGQLAENATDPALRSAMQEVYQRQAQPATPEQAHRQPAPESTKKQPREKQTRAASSHDSELDEAHAIWEEIEAAQQAQQAQAEQARAQHHARRAHPEQARQKRDAQQTKQAQLSLRTVFRKLASALHPDRELDALARERKTALMQRANQAYADSRLLDLLQLQLEAELMDNSQLARIDDSRLQHFNHMLALQLAELQREIQGLEQEWRWAFGLPTGAKLHPGDLAKRLRQQAQWLRQTTHHLRMDLRALQDPALLKHWLKQQRDTLHTP